MKTIFLDREIANLESLNEGQYRLNASGHAKLTEFKAIKQALTIPVVSNQRELLIAFFDYLDELPMGLQNYNREGIVEAFKSSL